MKDWILYWKSIAKFHHTPTEFGFQAIRYDSATENKFLLRSWSRLYSGVKLNSRQSLSVNDARCHCKKWESLTFNAKKNRIFIFSPQAGTTSAACRTSRGRRRTASAGQSTAATPARCTSRRGSGRTRYTMCSWRPRSRQGTPSQRMSTDSNRDESYSVIWSLRVL